MIAFRRAQYLFQLMVALGAAFSFGTPPVYAQGGIPGYPDSVLAYDPREVSILPNWCIYTHGFNARVPGGADRTKIDYWRSTMGKARDGNPIFEGVHHYCFGLMKTNRAIVLARNPRVRMFYLNDAIGEFDYVIRIAPRDFVLLPEILTKKGENLLRLNRVSLGIQAFEEAIELKPDYWPPYAYISDYYKSIGNFNKARELLEKGLSSSPDANALRTRLTELDAAKDKRKTVPQRTGEPAAPEPPAGK